MVSIASIKTDHLIGNQVGTSTIVSELARGGMAIVFIAYQRTLKRQIAVKVLPKALLTPKTAELFQQEAEAVAILSHPNIIQIYEVGETDEFLFFTMQLVKGTPLSSILKMMKKNIIPSKRKIPVPIAVRFTTQILDALDYAHNQDIVHRDIKPGNILIEKHTQRCLITDFGIAQVLQNQSGERKVVQGTPVYMAPEQILGLEVDGRADIYATGTMLFQMLAGDLPLPNFDSKPAFLKYKLTQKDGLFEKMPSEMDLAVHPQMDQIIQKATAYQPTQRYENCRSFLQELETYQKDHLN